MVEHLTEKTLQQEDQIQTLEEEKADLVRRKSGYIYFVKKMTSFLLEDKRLLLMSLIIEDVLYLELQR